MRRSNKPMADIKNRERGLSPESRALNRDAGFYSMSRAADAPTAAPAESRYWAKANQVHKVVFPMVRGPFNGKFDFRPSGAKGDVGSVQGTGVASSHHGTYKIIRNAGETFQMQVTLGTDEDPMEDMNATLVIQNGAAIVSGTLKKKMQEPAPPVPVTGAGTERDPFRVAFSEQELVWYLP